MKDILKITSIIFYLLIILMGEMIGIPFVLWLIFTIFDFGNIDQAFAIFGITGIGLNFTKWKNNVSITIASFFLMLSPIISRLFQVSLNKFNYLTFEIPLTLFIVLYLMFIFINIKEKLSKTAESI